MPRPAIRPLSDAATPDQADPGTSKSQPAGFRIGRLVPLLIVLLITATIIATGWYRQLSLENLVRHRAEIDAFIAAHGIAALAAYVALYFASVALSIPGAIVLSITAGLLFGTVVGGLVVLFGATAGATAIFLIARSAFG